MKGFVNNLINRHIGTEANIVPRLRGRFEPEQNSFHKNINPIVSNPFDAFSERIKNPDEVNPGNETGAYQPAANTGRQDARLRRQADSKNQPETPAQDNYNAANTSLIRPAGLIQVADNFAKESDYTESVAPNVPQSLNNRQNTAYHQHDFNSHLTADQINNPSRLIVPNSGKPENNSESVLFAANVKSPANIESADSNDNVSGLKTQVPVQSATGFNTLITGIQHNLSVVSPSNASNSNLRNPGQQYQQQTAQPVIRVTIGRIEVKAVHQQPPAPVPRREPQKPALTLDDFLTQHKRNEQ